MKRLKYILLTVLALPLLGSCDQNETPVYDVNRTALNIWFGTEQTPIDSLTYNYSYAMGESSVEFWARIEGVPADTDRTFTLEAVSGDIAEAQGSFRTETYTIPAGQTTIKGAIYFDTSKLAHADAFTQKEGSLHFRVTPGNGFLDGVKELSELVVILKNYLAKPDNWDNAVSPYYSLKLVFGDYSKEKYQFMIDVLGIKDFAINRNATVPYNEEDNEVSYNYAQYMKEKLQLALAEYNATHEEPLKDASGALITF